MATTYIPLYTTTLASAVSSVTISPISAGYTDLVLVLSMMGETGNIDTRLTFNGDTSTNYSMTRLYGDGTSAGSNRTANRAFIDTNYAGNVSTSVPTTSIVSIMNYANTTTYKTVLVRSADLGGTYQATNAMVGMWRGSTGSATQAITSLTITGTSNFKIGSTFSLYGVAAASVGAKATGGDFIGNDGTYYYHTFTSSGTFTPSQALTCDYLVVAGGGAGAGRGSRGGGGGGAGGLRSTVTATGGGGALESALALASGTGYTVTIGAGGAGNPSTITAGSNSVFASITSVGGGQGSYGNSAGAGGSGGGGDGTTNNGGAGTSNQGFAGGNGGVGGSYGGGGGGGAGAVGAANSGTTGGNGGTGVAVAITGSSVFYAGGGGAGAVGTAGTGGAGGGGNGSTSTNGTAGVANTGGGGGGSGSSTDFLNSNGGSGLVIVRYPI